MNVRSPALEVPYGRASRNPRTDSRATYDAPTSYYEASPAIIAHIRGGRRGAAAGGAAEKKAAVSAFMIVQQLSLL